MVKEINGNFIYNIPNGFDENLFVTFSGSGNILYFEEGISKISKSKFTFKGNNSLVYISNTPNEVKLEITIYHDSVIFIDNNIAINNTVTIYTSEQKNVFIGKDTLFSNSIIIRTSDAHRIFSIETMKRINQGKSVFIGDHVWIGGRANILKNSKIHSGSIIGCDSVLTGKEVLSNSMWAGNPARCRKTKIFYDAKGTHALGGVMNQPVKRKFRVKKQ